MREINIGDKPMKIHGSPLTLLFYRQAFDCDILGEIIELEKLASDPTKINTVALMQMTWAMGKTAAFGKGDWPDFMTWLTRLEWFDFTNQDLIVALVEEAGRSLFRPTKANKQ